MQVSQKIFAIVLSLILILAAPAATVMAGAGSGTGTGGGKGQPLVLESSVITNDNGRAQVIITFSKNISNASVVADNLPLIRVVDAQGQAVDAEIYAPDDQIEFDKRNNFYITFPAHMPSPSYTIIAGQGITSKSGVSTTEDFKVEVSQADLYRAIGQSPPANPAPQPAAPATPAPSPAPSQDVAAVPASPPAEVEATPVEETPATTEEAAEEATPAAEDDPAEEAIEDAAERPADGTDATTSELDQEPTQVDGEEDAEGFMFLVIFLLVGLAGLGVYLWKWSQGQKKDRDDTQP